jgi:hypothetical protein
VIYPQVPLGLSGLYHILIPDPPACLHQSDVLTTKLEWLPVTPHHPWSGDSSLVIRSLSPLQPHLFYIACRLTQLWAPAELVCCLRTVLPLLLGASQFLACLVKCKHLDCVSHLSRTFLCERWRWDSERWLC